jgi:histone H3/H4
MSSPTAKTPPASVEKASNKAEENVKKVEETANKGPPSAIEFEPPLACVRRILKNSLPSSTNVGKDASAAFARASGIFIIYVTACANDFARENRRQTITANDVLAAIKVRQQGILIHQSGSNTSFTRKANLLGVPFSVKSIGIGI